MTQINPFLSIAALVLAGALASGCAGSKVEIQDTEAVAEKDQTALYLTGRGVPAPVVAFRELYGCHIQDRVRPRLRVHRHAAAPDTLGIAVAESVQLMQAIAVTDAAGKYGG